MSAFVQCLLVVRCSIYPGVCVLGSRGCDELNRSFLGNNM